LYPDAGSDAGGWRARDKFAAVVETAALNGPRCEPLLRPLRDEHILVGDFATKAMVSRDRPSGFDMNRNNAKLSALARADSQAAIDRMGVV
jgi:hypothetical protein